MTTVRPRFKFWLESEDAEGFFGNGKYRLLQAIDETGSLSAAAEMLNISYRKAWGDLKKAEAGFGFKLIEKSRGGHKGGETLLTQEGRALMALFISLRTSMEQQASELFDKETTEITCD